MAVHRVVNTYIVPGSAIEKHAIRQVLEVLGYDTPEDQMLEDSKIADGLYYHPASGITWRAVELETDRWAYEVQQIV